MPGHLSLLPETRLGRWAAWLTLASILLWLLAAAVGGDATIPSLLAAICAVVAGVLALIAILGRKERAATAFIALFLLAATVALVVWRNLIEGAG